MACSQLAAKEIVRCHRISSRYRPINKNHWHRKLIDRRIRHVYEEFEDTHSDIDYRYDVSLPLLWKALKA